MYRFPHGDELDVRHLGFTGLAGLESPEVVGKEAHVRKTHLGGSVWSIIFEKKTGFLAAGAPLSWVVWLPPEHSEVARRPKGSPHLALDTRGLPCTEHAPLAREFTRGVGAVIGLVKPGSPGRYPIR